MAGRPIRIELRGLADQREDAQRDLQMTLGALEDRLLPRRAVRRLVTRHDPRLVMIGLAATGLALGLIRDPSPAARAGALVAAAAAGAGVFRQVRSSA
jgi:hypothetical protein